MRFEVHAARAEGAHGQSDGVLWHTRMIDGGRNRGRRGQGWATPAGPWRGQVGFHGRLAPARAMDLYTPMTLHEEHSRGHVRNTVETRERWRIDDTRSTLSFRVRHMALPDIEGHFGCWGGVMLLDRSDPVRSTVRLWVDLSSIETGSPRRDAAIFATELFDLHWEPAVVFDSTRVDVHDDRHATLIGQLAVHTFRHEVRVAIEGHAPRREDAGARRLAYSAHASVDRATFGLRRRRHIVDWLAERFLAEAIEIAAEVELTRDFGSALEPVLGLPSVLPSVLPDLSVGIAR
jgi:polyisoprenoid-binding protein YceI